MTEEQKAAIRAAAERHSDLSDKLNDMATMNTPTDPVERKEARVGYALLQAEVIESANALNSAINAKG